MAPTTQKPTVFLDDGDVMNDNALRPHQWQLHVGAFMSERLGGVAAAWEEANKIAFPRMLDHHSKGGWKGYGIYWENYLRDWLEALCKHLKMSVPANAAALAIAKDASAYVTRRVHAAFPGVIDAIRELHAGGFRLHTASAEHSSDLAGYLEAMDVRQLFGRLYGPDLVETAKGGPEYYRSIFADAGVDPGSSVVVDDSTRAIGWATEAGTTAVLVTPTGAKAGKAHVIRRVAELPSLVDRLGDS